jgi:ribonuclease HII
MSKYLIGIDEVGRGPLAGPVCVCAVLFRKPLPRGFLAGLKDSKALSIEKREQWFAKASAAQKSGLIDYSVSFSSAAYIDRVGIVKALRKAISRSLSRLNAEPISSRVLLDGSLQAPASFSNQKTIVKGDERIPIIALASVIAKVKRDRRMRCYVSVFPGYGFEKHVGYGTAEHYRAISRLGICKLHRVSFLSSVKKKTRNPR